MVDLPTPPYTEATGVPAAALEEALAVATAALRTYATVPRGEVALTPTQAAVRVLDAVAPTLIAGGRAQAADDLIGLIPREYAQILAWLSRHRLGLAPGAGAVLSWLRRDMDALVASWAGGGGVADHPRDATASK